MFNPDLKYWLALSSIPGLGAVRFKKLYSYFATMAQAWQADYSALLQAGLEPSLAREVVQSRQVIDPDAKLAELAKENIQAVTVTEEDYPALLKEIYSPPPVLYYKGQLNHPADSYAVAVVGTRKFSPYGRRVTEDIVVQLAQQNVPVVSGLALGIDAIAHQAAVDAQGRTIAVLGSGLNQQNIYPSANRYLAHKILAEDGLLISEYPPNTLALQGHFPQRNRIIAGLSLAILVIEAPQQSGALITAQHALEFNRDVLAVPGDIYHSNAQGTNNLIKLGAKLVTAAADVLEALNMQNIKQVVENREIIPDSTEEKLILEHLTSEPVHINHLIKLSGLSTAMVNSTLLLMEMKGKVKHLGGQMYVKGR